MLKKKKIKLFFLKLFKVPYCHKCLRGQLSRGHWIRAWDMVYGGAGGDGGIRCFHCGYIEWDNTYEEFVKLMSVHPQYKLCSEDPQYKDGLLIDAKFIEAFTTDHTIAKIDQSKELEGCMIEVHATNDELEAIGIRADFLKRPMIGLVTKDYQDGYIEVQLELTTPLLNRSVTYGHSILKTMVKNHITE